MNGIINVYKERGYTSHDVDVYKRQIGESVDVRLFRAIDRQKEFTGILKAWDKDTVTLEFEDEATLVIERSNIALIRLAFDF